MHKNLLEINENIKTAAAKSGRTIGDITLLGVTKTIPIETIQTALQFGITHLGENRVQEFLPKYEALQNFLPAPRWHMIGTLQTNKVKFIIDKVEMIHSVDNTRLALEINKRAAKLAKVMDILVEINIAHENTKHGILPENAIDFLVEIHNLTNICIKGLMCIAPYVENPEENRRFFEKMRKLFLDIASAEMHNTNMTHLSMGMSNDYAIAIEEGANIVRIGTSLFGDR